MSKNKSKGTTFETQLVNYMKANGFPDVYRPALTGAGDIGDVVGISGWISVPDVDGGSTLGTPNTMTVKNHVIIQAKNQKAFQLSGWLNDTVKQAANRGPGTIPLLAVKRPGIGPQNLGKTYVIMQLEDAVRLLDEAGYS